MNNTQLGLGWETLATKLGFKGNYSIIAIKNIASGQKKSPSVLVLDDFFKDNKDADVLTPLMILSNALGEMENHDARELVEEEITQRSEQMKLETGKTSNMQDSEVGSVILTQNWLITYYVTMGGCYSAQTKIVYVLCVI